MKPYIFTKERKRKKYSTIYKCKIYRLKNNKPVYVDECSVYVDPYIDGVIHSVFRKLIELKEIPKKYNTLSKNTFHHGDGYYCREVIEKGIKIIEV